MRHLRRGGGQTVPVPDGWSIDGDTDRNADRSDPQRGGDTPDWGRILSLACLGDAHPETPILSALLEGRCSRFDHPAQKVAQEPGAWIGLHQEEASHDTKRFDRLVRRCLRLRG